VQTETVNAVTILALRKWDRLDIAKSRPDLRDVLSCVRAEGDLAGDGSIKMTLGDLIARGIFRRSSIVSVVG